MSDDNEHMWQQVEDAVSDERERCARLCEMRARISRDSAVKMRADGQYTTWFSPTTHRVYPKWEKAAKTLEGVADTIDSLALCIRKGYDTRDLEDPNEQIKRWEPCPECQANGLCARHAKRTCDRCDFSTGFVCRDHR